MLITNTELLSDKEAAAVRSAVRYAFVFSSFSRSLH